MFSQKPYLATKKMQEKKVKPQNLRFKKISQSGELNQTQLKYKNVKNENSSKLKKKKRYDMIIFVRFRSKKLN